jgi:hypothetical protein
MKKNKTYNKKVKPISQNVAISKLFFFPSWKCGDLNFFFGNFSKCLLHHVCCHRGLFNGFSSQKIN